MLLSMRSLWLYHTQEAAQIKGKIWKRRELGFTLHIHILYTELTLVSEPEGLYLL